MYLSIISIFKVKKLDLRDESVIFKNFGDLSIFYLCPKPTILKLELGSRAELKWLEVKLGSTLVEPRPSCSQATWLN